MKSKNATKQGAINETDKQVCDRIFWNVLGCIVDDDSELALHGLTSVIAQIVQNCDPAERTQSMIDVLHMLADPRLRDLARRPVAS